jgi:hypothetical protein
VIIVESPLDTNDYVGPLIIGMICSALLTVTVLLVSKYCCRKKKEAVQQEEGGVGPLDTTKD